MEKKQKNGPVGLNKSIRILLGLDLMMENPKAFSLTLSANDPLRPPITHRVSRKGLIAYASSTDCVGPIASSVADVAALLGAIAGADPCGDATAIKHPVPDYTAILQQVHAPMLRPCKT